MKSQQWRHQYDLNEVSSHNNIFIWKHRGPAVPKNIWGYRDKVKDMSEGDNIKVKIKGKYLKVPTGKIVWTEIDVGALASIRPIWQSYPTRYFIFCIFSWNLSCKMFSWDRTPY